MASGGVLDQLTRSLACPSMSRLLVIAAFMLSFAACGEENQLAQTTTTTTAVPRSTSTAATATTTTTAPTPTTEPPQCYPSSVDELLTVLTGTDDEPPSGAHQVFTDVVRYRWSATFGGEVESVDTYAARSIGARVSGTSESDHPKVVPVLRRAGISWMRQTLVGTASLATTEPSNV